VRPNAADPLSVAIPSRAALILAISFIALSTNPNVLVRIIASALAFGIVVDTVIIRTLLVPAIVSLMGRVNWWMPPALARLLRTPSDRKPLITPEP